MQLKSLCLCLLPITALVEGTSSNLSKPSFVPRTTIVNDITYTYTAASKRDDPILLIDSDIISTGTSSYQKALLLTRGGAYHNDDFDEYDAYYDDEYDGDDYDLHGGGGGGDDHYNDRANAYTNRNSNRNNNGSRSDSRRPHNQRPPPRPSQPPPRRRSGHGPPPNSNYRGRNNNKRSSSSSSSTILSTTADIAQKSLNVATSATLTTLKTSGRAAYYLTAPKHVQKDELYGIWRFDQSIGESVCAANIEFTLRGDAITRYGNDEENVTAYFFQSKSWPRSCSIEFEAEAFQGVEDTRPVRYYYKGYFRRKMADKSVIKIVGKIYEVKKRFWKGKDGPGVAGVEVGSFVARKRMQANRDDIYGGEEYDDDDYDDYDYDGDDDYGDLYDDTYDRNS